jgi:dienelactone hydrolase
MRFSLIACTIALLGGPASLAAQARFDFPRDTTLTDERIRIVLRGAPPNSFVTIRLAVAAQRSWATFIADRTGSIDLERQGPVAGTYGGADPMGLFWSARAEPGQVVRPGAQFGYRPGTGMPPAIPFQLIGETSGAAIATDTVWRRVMSPNVKISEVRDAGFTATLYEPRGNERRAAIVLLSGSQGGRMQPIVYPGGYASRGYVVMSLAFFKDDGVPASLSNVPLEYFEKALTWLRARPNVDSMRVGLQGGSKGAETALLVAATYPRLVRAVAATVPGSVVWNGCCDSISSLGPSFTLGGKPLPHMPHQVTLASQLTAISQAGPVRLAPLFMHRLADSAAVARAAIPVERIQGAILLVSAKDDGLWPSSYMSEQIMARLRAHNFHYPYKHLAYEGAGHFISRPYISVVTPEGADPVTGRRNDSGGTPLATQRAREQSWIALLAFFDEHLRGVKPRI